MRTVELPSLYQFFLVSFLALALCGCANEPDHFGIYTARFDGSQCRTLTSDRSREINHARLSPDRSCITFTRFNHPSGLNGQALEENGYEETEIMLMDPDGKNLRAVVPAKPGIVNANSQFTADSKYLIYVTTDHTDHKSIQGGEIALLDRKSGKTKLIIPQPAIDGCISYADPHVVGDWIVFTALIPYNGVPLNQVWIMHFDGSGARRLTNPQNCLRTVGKANPPAGDFDPKLSPDGSRVVFMRHVSAFSFATLLVDVATGKEQELSPNLSPDAADAVPEWSADGKTILFWRIDRSKLSDCGIWKMTADGRYRQRIPLPRGYFYTMPAFFPGESALPNSEIIFSGHRQFGL